MYEDQGCSGEKLHSGPNLNVESMVSVKYSLKQYPSEIFAKVTRYVYVYGYKFMDKCLFHSGK